MKRNLLITIVVTLLVWHHASALQGGPTMPEYVKFEPTDITDIVNMNTGDFVYSVPLGDVPGPAGSFPISMSYHSGVGHEQEATWVGLGWTLNPGAVNRMLRGVADDIHNSATLSYIYAHDRRTGWGVNVGAGWGPVGLDMTYDTDKGFGGSVSLGAQIGPAQVGVDIGTNGVGLDASVGAFQASIDKDGATVAVGYQGKGILAANASLGVHSTWSGHLSTVGGIGLSARPMPGNASTSLVGFSFNSASTSGGSFSIAGTGFSSMTAGGSGMRNSFDQGGFGATIPIYGGFWIKVGWSNYVQEMWLSDATMMSMYGYMYQGGQAVKINSLNNLNVAGGGGLAKTGATTAAAGTNARYANFIWNNKGPTLENLELGESDEIPPADRIVKGGSNHEIWYWAMAPSYDVFTASGPGVSGSFRPYAKHPMSMYQALVKQYQTDASLTSRNFLLKPNDQYSWDEQADRVFPLDEETDPISAANMYYNGTNPDPGYPEEDYYFCRDGHVNFNTVGTSTQAVADFFSARNSDGDPSNDCSPYAFLKSNIRNENNRLVISSDDEDRFRATDKTNMRFGFINELGEYDKYAFGDTVSWSYGGRQIIPLMDNDLHGNGSEGGKLKGFKIIDQDGKQYLFETPVYSLFQVDYSTDHPLGAPTFQKDGSERFSWQAQITPYATQWLLTEVRGADFIKVSETDLSQNYGYQIKLKYTQPVPYNWRTPYAAPNTPMNQLKNFSLGSKDKYIGSMGQKELVYLESIESATHKAVFNLNDQETEDRKDSREWKTSWFSQSGQTGNGNPPLDVPVTLAFEYRGNAVSHGGSAHQWEDVTGAPFPEATIPDEPSGPKTLYGIDADYECSVVYIPVVPTSSQLDRLRSNGVSISGYNVALTYYAYYYGTFPIFSNADLRPVGPRIQDPSTGYTNYSVSDIQATVGNEERFGPYKLILSTPIHRRGLLIDAFDVGQLPASHCKLSRSGSVTIPFSTPC